MVNRAANYIGIGRKAGAVITGEENCASCVHSGKAYLLCVAGDASEHAKRHAENYVYETAIPLAELPFTKEELAELTGRPLCSMLAFTDAGLAAGMLQALLPEQPELAPAAEQLQRDAEFQHGKKRSRGSGNRRN